ncbi:uncharacterized protein PODANS_3_2960 [Podospora anserina S mat+]|uniref:Podospora anserina S mat+ genomic DNA chromosome 3, supercontig 2 n=1 Tax=Podospora anserina (strain S / ATCC MYA-4624 / DSM 980 / FGSC 10383) TaxID=515849 RepID=B2AZ93_PODAN|nr:uncharacterized protein PODANS_3_2960 [Podospora anserina S mat+]CAP70207.1 unnamed protein product [Podospora anserina S mat+]CDP26800.1 Putative protein of unknown function [Podospora anserina S mat+]
MGSHAPPHHNHHNHHPQHPDADPAQAVDGLVRAIRDLTSDPNYKLVADVFSEFLFVKEQNNQLSTSHQVLLEEYRKFRNELEDQKEILVKERREMELVVQEKVQEIFQLTATRTRLETDLEATHRALEEEIEAATHAAEAAAKKYADLRDQTTLEYADLKARKEQEYADLVDLKKLELSELKALTTKQYQDLEAAKLAVEEEKKTNEAAAAAAAVLAAGTIAALTAAKAELEKTLEQIKADNDATIQALKEKAEGLEAAEKALEEELEAAKQKIATLETALEERNKEISGLQESLRAAEEQITSLQQTLEEKNNEIDELHGKLTTETTRAEKAESENHDLHNRLEDTEHNLEVTSNKLADLEQYRIELQHDNEDTYVAVLDKIWTTIVTLVETSFRHDIDNAILSDASCWTNLRSSPYLKMATQLQIPLPQSNTAAAKGMRISAVLAILSRALHRHIFRPNYLLEDDDEPLLKFLRALEDDDPAREAHFRATMLAMMPERQLEQAARRVKTVVREVSWVVQHLLTALQFEAFCTGLEAACRLACEQWMRIQVANMKIEPYFGPPYDDYDWQVLDLPEFAEAIENDKAVETDEEVPPTSIDERLESALAEASKVPIPASIRTVSAAGTLPGDKLLVNDTDNGSLHSAHEHEDEFEGEVDPDEILLVVWPSMCCVENGELMSITQGLVISKEQARPALDESRPPRPKLIARPGSRRARTMSMPAGQSRSGSPQRAMTGKVTNHFMMMARELDSAAAEEVASQAASAT